MSANRHPSSVSPAAAPFFVPIGNLPPALARGHELIQARAQQLNDRLSALEQAPDKLRESAAWQKQWKRGVEDLAAMLDLAELLEIPIVRLVARRLHDQRQNDLAEQARNAAIRQASNN